MDDDDDDEFKQYRDNSSSGAEGTDNIESPEKEWIRKNKYSEEDENTEHF